MGHLVIVHLYPGPVPEHVVPDIRKAYTGPVTVPVDRLVIDV